DLPLTPNRFPGLEIALPSWLASERSVYFENGNIRLTDPGDARQFVSVRWTSGDPVQPDEFVKVATGGTMSVRDREPMPVGGHEGTTFYLEDADRASRAAVTIWNCPPDHRSIWIVTSLNLRKSALMDA